MLCRNPFVRDASGKIIKAHSLGGHDSNGLSGRDLLVRGLPFPCGQCLPCRINRRRVWTLRILLESMLHDASSFVTLTYSEMPHDFSVSKRDIQLWLKRFRLLYPHPVRYFAVGEYGYERSRPHYHSVLFGVPPEAAEYYVQKTWDKGLIHVGHDCSIEAMQYVAGYVVKKFVNKHTDSRTPEFILCSRRPGIGARAVPLILDALKGVQDESPTSLSVGRKSFPLGRYLGEKLRESGLSGDRGFDLYASQITAAYWTHKQDFIEALKAIDDGKVDRLEWRSKNLLKRDTL